MSYYTVDTLSIILGLEVELELGGEPQLGLLHLPPVVEVEKVWGEEHDEREQYELSSVLSPAP